MTLKDNLEYLSELLSLKLIIEDIRNVYTSGDLLDMIVYTIAIGLAILLGIYLITFILEKTDKVIKKTKHFMEWISKDARTKRKADKYTQKLERFEQELSDEEASKKAKKAREEEEEKLNIQRKRELMQAEEMIAISQLNYSFFVPENGYPHGPTLEHRIKLEEERVRRSDYRLLSAEERQLVAQGFSADGLPFGDSTHQDLFLELWKNRKSSNVVKGFSNTSIKSSKTNNKQSGNVISLPVQKK